MVTKCFCLDTHIIDLSLFHLSLYCFFSFGTHLKFVSFFSSGSSLSMFSSVDAEISHKEVANCTVKFKVVDAAFTVFFVTRNRSVNYYTTYYLNMQKFLSRKKIFWLFLVSTASLSSLSRCCIHFSGHLPLSFNLIKSFDL
jgi:hypothetical protein